MYYVFSNKKCMFLVMCTLHELLQLLYNYLNTHSEALTQYVAKCSQSGRSQKIKTCETNFTIPWCLMSHFKAASLQLNIVKSILTWKRNSKLCGLLRTLDASCTASFWWIHSSPCPCDGKTLLCRHPRIQAVFGSLGSRNQHPKNI